LLRCLEQADQTALAHHVHRKPPMGSRVLITAGWYECATKKRELTSDLQIL
jgi:hypothetical protein